MKRREMLTVLGSLSTLGLGAAGSSVEAEPHAVEASDRRGVGDWPFPSSVERNQWTKINADGFPFAPLEQAFEAALAKTP